jgi:Fatty acid synthesis protein
VAKALLVGANSVESCHEEKRQTSSTTAENSCSTGKLFLVGDAVATGNELRRLDFKDARIEIFHASEVVSMKESAAKAVRHKKDASICRAVDGAQRIAGHAGSRTTKLYDRRGQKVLLEDMERNAELDIWSGFGTEQHEQGQPEVVKFQQRYQMRNRILSKAVPGLEFRSFCNSHKCVPLVRQFWEPQNCRKYFEYRRLRKLL